MRRSVSAVTSGEVSALGFCALEDAQPAAPSTVTPTASIPTVRHSGRRIAPGQCTPGARRRCTFPLKRAVPRAKPKARGPGKPRAGAAVSEIVLGDNLEVLRRLPDGFARLVYIDPPFNTGGPQRRDRIATVRDAQGDRIGFAGERYRSVKLGSQSFADQF